MIRDNKILLVEDDEDILKVVTDQLRLDGFEVKGVTNGKEAIDTFGSFCPDLVVLDLNLPDVDGLIVCQHLRKISSVPIIILSARDSLPDKIRGLEVGADDYVTKPFEYLELLARIKACLRRRQLFEGDSSDKLELGDLKIFLKGRQVLVKDKPVKLTKKEFDLLQLLVMNRDRVLSREYLSSHLWDNKEVYPWSRALDVHIRRLRKKIEPDPANPVYIITHPGLGYKFNPGS